MWKWILLGYLLVINIIGLIGMYVDKKRAIKGNWRLSENMLMLFAALGGGIGSMIGMYSFRHKTKHKKFTVIMPIVTIIAYAVIIALVYIFAIEGSI